MNALEFLQDEKGAMSVGRLCQLFGIVLGFAYIMYHPSDGNFQVFMMSCGGAYLFSKGGDTAATIFGAKNVSDNAS